MANPNRVSGITSSPYMPKPVSITGLKCACYFLSASVAVVVGVFGFQHAVLFFTSSSHYLDAKGLNLRKTVKLNKSVSKSQQAC